MAPRKKTKLLTCANCGGGLRLEDPSYGLTCPRCQIRVAGPFTNANEIPDYIPASSKPRKRKAKESSFDIKERRLKSLQARMASVVENVAWYDTDTEALDSWIDVDAELSDAAWLRVAQEQLLEQNVLPEHAGAASANVYAWNDAFISTYRMLIDEGYSRDAAADSARQNANDTVKLTANEHALVKDAPELYEKRR